MRVIQRIGSFFQGEKLKRLIECTKTYKNCFNEVWLNTEYGYPTLETHRRVAKAHAESAKMLRDAGIRVSMQLSNTMGHGQYMMTRDCSGLIYDGSPARNMVGHDGTVAKYAFCWNDRFFRDYITEQVRIYVTEVQPEEFWVDDDFRARNHAPVQFGCYCDDCINRFNKKRGTSFTREALVEEFLHGDIQVRADYIDFIREGLAGLMEEICLAVKESSPKTRVALQNGPNGPYTGRGHGYIFDTIYKATGKPPLYRPGGGAYDDHDPNAIIDKIYYLEYQMALLPEYVKDICPEIENTPDTAMGKSMHGTALETAMNLANGATDISYAMLGALPEPIEFYERGFKLFSEQYPYWERLAALSQSSRAGGITYITSQKGHLRKLGASDGMNEFNRENFTEANVLIKNGIPITYFDTGVYLLHPAAARQMADGELKALLSKNVLTDAEAVEYIQSRGIDMGFEMFTASEQDCLVMKELYTDSPLNNGYKKDFISSFFSKGYTNHRILTKIPENTDILGVYAENKHLKRVTNDERAPYGYSTVITNTKEGGRWAVMAYGLWKSTVPSSQRDRILNITDCLSNGLPARIVSSDKAIIMPRVDALGKTLAVSVTNCTIGKADIKIKIRDPKSEKFTFASQYDGEAELRAEKCEDGYALTLPTLSPWSVGTVFCC